MRCGTTQFFIKGSPDMERNPKKLLITAFEPFGGETVNAAERAVFSLPDRIGNWELCRCMIPVAFGRAADVAAQYARENGSDAILCIGQATGRSEVTPEMIAINLRYARIPDNDGQIPLDEPVMAGGREAYFSTAPARRIAEAIKAHGLPASVSYSAGTYVCNDVFYRLLGRFEGTSVRVGFIHVPVTPAQGSPSLETSVTASALACAIEALEP